jgi:hypothetical protein
MGVSNASSKSAQRGKRELGKERLTSRRVCARCYRVAARTAVDFDSSPVRILLAEQAKHVGDEKNQQYCPQTYAGPATRAPAGMAVVPSTEAKNQY